MVFQPASIMTSIQTKAAIDIKAKPPVRFACLHQAAAHLTGNLLNINALVALMVDGG
jgi:hypothetical protein